jgi:hypothetical protein
MSIDDLNEAKLERIFAQLEAVAQDLHRQRVRMEANILERERPQLTLVQADEDD